ncbi:MAG: EAL domain-containing protein [Gammaproteobacteria bacterium]|nr:EAL domain-containing protein [Gammaproteobacteria bacterium]
MSAEDMLIAEFSNETVTHRANYGHFIKTIVKHTPSVLLTLNELGQVTYIDGNSRDILGFDTDEMLGENLCLLHQSFTSMGDLIRQAMLGDEVTGTFEANGNQLRLWFSPIRKLNRIDHITVTCLDITSNLEMERALKEMQRHYLLLAEHSTDLITKYTNDGVCRYASPATTKVLGYRPDEIIGRVVFELFHPNDQKSKRRIIPRLLSDSGNETICYRVKHNDGHYVWMETRTKATMDPHTGDIAEIIAVSRDITERKESEERLLYLANYDSLTGLPNRALFRDRLRRAIARAQRNSGKVALMFLDLDRFKTINDSLGHHAGDQLLRGVARRLKQHAREGDTIARLGGDEFTVILEGVKDSDDAAIVAEKILELMQAPFRLDGHEVVVTPSIGITIFPDDADDMRSLLKNADTAMYRSKETGRNGFQFYTADMNAKAYELLLLENNLRHAMERNEFELHYQPQIDLHSQAVIGLEALLRWKHPERGMIQPETFIPYAEETGMIIQIGQYVLREACREAKKWADAGLQTRVAVNLSMYQFVDKDFVVHVADALRETQLPAHMLELEVTESFLAHNVEQAAETLRRLHRLGVHLSIDDFGTGYSSLSYLKQFPLNTLKIDQSFVQDIGEGNDSATIAEAIVGLGKSLGLNVIAEGVEKDEQMYFLRDRGCDLAQGFLISHPMEASKVIPWLRQNRKHQAHFKQWVLWPEMLAHGHA